MYVKTTTPIALISLMSLLAACAAAPRPTLIDGQYFMAGDSDCSRARIVNSLQIMCADRNGRETAMRVSMTPSQLAQYGLQQQHTQQALREITDGLNDLANTMNAQAQAQAARNAQWTPPGVQPVSPTSTTTRCLINGRYVYCKSQ